MKWRKWRKKRGGGEVQCGKRRAHVTPTNTRRSARHVTQTAPTRLPFSTRPPASNSASLSSLSSSVAVLPSTALTHYAHPSARIYMGTSDTPDPPQLASKMAQTELK